MTYTYQPLSAPKNAAPQSCKVDAGQLTQAAAESAISPILPPCLRRGALVQTHTERGAKCTMQQPSNKPRNQQRYERAISQHPHSLGALEYGGAQHHRGGPSATRRLGPRRGQPPPHHAEPDASSDRQRQSPVK